MTPPAIPSHLSVLLAGIDVIRLWHDDAIYQKHSLNQTSKRDVMDCNLARPLYSTHALHSTSTTAVALEAYGVGPAVGVLNGGGDRGREAPLIPHTAAVGAPPHGRLHARPRSAPDGSAQREEQTEP